MFSLPVELRMHMMRYHLVYNLKKIYKNIVMIELLLVTESIRKILDANEFASLDTINVVSFKPEKQRYWCLARCHLCAPGLRCAYPRLILMMQREGHLTYCDAVFKLAYTLGRKRDFGIYAHAWSPSISLGRIVYYSISSRRMDDLFILSDLFVDIKHREDTIKKMDENLAKVKKFNEALKHSSCYHNSLMDRYCLLASPQQPVQPSEDPAQNSKDQHPPPM